MSDNSDVNVDDNLEVFAVSSDPTGQSLNRPCVDCGATTTWFCDNDACLAKLRVPSERWELGQRTPLCRVCEFKYSYCHFCRNVPWAQGFPKPYPGHNAELAAIAVAEANLRQDPFHYLFFEAPRTSTVQCSSGSSEPYTKK